MKGGWQMKPHEKWVKGGGCPVVNWAGSWCNDRAGHAGLHWSLRVFPDGRTERETWNR